MNFLSLSLSLSLGLKLSCLPTGRDFDWIPEAEMAEMAEMEEVEEAG